MSEKIIKNEKEDKINHPSHYNQGSIETIDLIEDWNLDFCLGNTVKYISRAGFKENNSMEQDLKKAYWYLKREISIVSKQDFIENKKNKYKYTPSEVCTDWHLDNYTSKTIMEIFNFSFDAKTDNEKIYYLAQALENLKTAISNHE